MGRREDEERNSSVRLSGALLCYWHRAIAGARVGIRHRASPVELPLFTEKEIKVNNQLQGGRAKIAPKSPATWSRCFTAPPCCQGRLPEAIVGPVLENRVKFGFICLRPDPREIIHF